MVDFDRLSQSAEARDAARWFRVLVRIGYVAKGLVYLSIGALSAQVAIGLRRETVDQAGVFDVVLEQPFGIAMLLALTLGLVGYAVWRIVQAALDPQGSAKGVKGAAKRLAYGGSGLAYLVFAYAAGRLALTAGRDPFDLSARNWTARLMDQPMGEWLVGLLGLAILGAGIYQGYQGIRVRFCANLEMARMSPLVSGLCLVGGGLGHVARGVVFSIIGVFLVRAALRADPRKAQGIGEALNTLLEQPFGPWLLLGVASGLVVYGLYTFLEAAYHRL
jgi:hypothetical protein